MTPLPDAVYEAAGFPLTDIECDLPVGCPAIFLDFPGRVSPRTGANPQCESVDDLYGWRCCGPKGHFPDHFASDPDDKDFGTIWHNPHPVRLAADPRYPFTVTLPSSSAALAGECGPT